MLILKSNKFYCFSPPIMMATFIIEVVFALYVIARYKMTPITRLAAAILIGLAVFQLAEYNICETAWGLDSLTWARIGYVAITFLPPLGLHLATRIAGQKQPLFIGLGYAVAAIFAFFFLFSGQGMTGQQCLGNYVIFSIAPWASKLYGVYYYGMLIMGVAYSWQASRHIKSKYKKQALLALAIGYLAFIIPTTTANIIDPTTIAGIPSIMCGFAVILAIILATVVVPRAHKK